MKDSYNNLPDHYKALIAIAVLIDGIDSEIYLQNDYSFGSELSSLAIEFGGMTPEIRVPLMGTLLRKLYTT